MRSRGQQLIHMDAPRHTQLRKLVNRGFHAADDPLMRALAASARAAEEWRVPDLPAGSVHPILPA